MRNLFITNGYLEHFVNKNMKFSRNSKSEFGPNKKNVYLSLPFEGDTQDEILTKRLIHAVKNTIYAGTVRIHFTSSPLLNLRLKDQVSDSFASFCVYCFTFSCGASYVYLSEFVNTIQHGLGVKWSNRLIVWFMPIWLTQITQFNLPKLSNSFT